MKELFVQLNEEMQKLASLDQEYDHIYGQLSQVSQKRRLKKLALLNSDYDHIYEELSRLSKLRREVKKKLAALVNNLAKTPWKWNHLGKSTHFKEYDWVESWSYIMAGYQFHISLIVMEDDGHLRYKVNVSGQKHDEGSNYMFRLYTPWELDRPFTTESEARDYVKQWQDRLIKDHESELKYQISIAQMVNNNILAHAN